MNPREYQVMFSVEDTHWWYRGLHELVLRMVASRYHGKGTLDILDAGCGTGRLCQLLQPFGNVTGCDIADIALALCRERGIANVFKADLNGADLGVERYDVITSLDVLYHRAITREEPVLASFFRALKPGGLLVINLVAFEFLRGRHDLAVHTRHRYRRAEVIQLLQTAGFSVDLCSYRLCLLFPLIAAYRLFHGLCSRGTDSDQVVSDVRPLNFMMNCLLEYMLRLENRLIELFPLPFGLSVFAVAEKPLGGAAGGERS